MFSLLTPDTVSLPDLMRRQNINQSNFSWKTGKLGSTGSERGEGGREREDSEADSRYMMIRVSRVSSGGRGCQCIKRSARQTFSSAATGGLELSAFQEI